MYVYCICSIFFISLCLSLMKMLHVTEARLPEFESLIIYESSYKQSNSLDFKSIWLPNVANKYRSLVYFCVSKFKTTVMSLSWSKLFWNINRIGVNGLTLSVAHCKCLQAYNNIRRHFPTVGLGQTTVVLVCSAFIWGFLYSCRMTGSRRI